MNFSQFAQRSVHLVVLAVLIAGVGGLASARGTSGQANHAPVWPSFEDRAAALPSPHVYAGGWEHFVGGGVAAFDCDGDGKLDVFAAGGTNPAQLLLNRAEGPGAPISFQRHPDVSAAPWATGVIGAYALDIDGDGPLDLFVLRVGANVALRNDGNCGLVDTTAAWGIDPGARWSTAFAATWEPGRAWPTLAVGNYVDRTDPAGPFEACDVNILHRHDGTRYGAPIALQPGYCALSMLISDWRRTGTPELRISNDRHYYVRDGHEQMWRLDPLGPRGAADGWDKVSLWGMGIASADLTGDGLPEVMLTSMGDQLLQFNDAGVMRNAPYSIGSYATRPHVGDEGRPSTGWHAAFGDVDNDGRLDLFIAKGNVDQMPSNALRDPNNLLLGTPQGTFVEAAAHAGIATTDRARGAALADLDGDGRLDIVVVNRRAPLEVWQNTTAHAGNWLAVQLTGAGRNTRAVGAWIEVRAGAWQQTHEVTVGGGHAGGTAGTIHFGLGAAEAAQVRVRWPTGAWSAWQAVAANQRVVLEQKRAARANSVKTESVLTGSWGPSPQSLSRKQ